MNSKVEFEFPSIAFFGRSLMEYERLFNLSVGVLRGTRILDVGAGPSSFTAEANRKGMESVAVDPLYGLNSDALAEFVRMDYARMFAEMRRKSSLIQLRTFSSIDEAELSRRAAAARFIDDYSAGFAAGRYVGGALPRLPFADREFELVLCAHLLCLYARKLDYGFHLAACRELCRVSRGEVRIHPLVELDGQPYRELERLRRDLAGEGISTNIVSVDHEVFAGANQTMIMRFISQ